MDDTILTTQQVAGLFGVHPNTVVKWADAGTIPHFRTPGKHRRYLRADVERVLAASKVTAPSEGDAA